MRKQSFTLTLTLTPLPLPIPTPNHPPTHQHPHPHPCSPTHTWPALPPRGLPRRLPWFAGLPQRKVLRALFLAGFKVGFALCRHCGAKADVSSESVHTHTHTHMCKYTHPFPPRKPLPPSYICKHTYIGLAQTVYGISIYRIYDRITVYRSFTITSEIK